MACVKAAMGDQRIHLVKKVTFSGVEPTPTIFILVNFNARTDQAHTKPTKTIKKTVVLEKKDHKGRHIILYLGIRIPLHFP